MPSGIRGYEREGGRIPARYSAKSLAFSMVRSYTYCSPNHVQAHGASQIDPKRQVVVTKQGWYENNMSFFPGKHTIKE